MKLNNKGFTLIELLAVVVVMLIISAIAIPSISSAIERNKSKQDDAKLDVIISTAKLYYDEHKNSLGSNGCILINKLELTENERKKSNGEYFKGGVRYNSGNFQYDETCS